MVCCRTMQYQAGVLPPGSGHSQAGRSHDFVAAERPHDFAAEHSPMPQPAYHGSSSFYPQAQPHYHPLSRPQPGECGVNVKEEPVEDEEDSGMVIDLTPRSLDAHDHIDLTGRDDVSQSAKHRPVFTGQNKAPVRHHPYFHSAPAASGSSFPISGAGNVPRLVTTDESYSDTDSQMQGDKSMDEQSSMVTGTFRFSIPKDSMSNISHTQPRAKREFVPDNKKDEQYWSKRHKNNISARRSRIKRKTMEKLMEHRMVELEQENIRLKYELKALKRMFGDRVSTDLSTSPAGSPESSSSSGIGMSNNSNMSSGGSAEHSTSSSPVLQMEDATKRKKANFQLKVKFSGGEGGEDCRREELDNQSLSPHHASSISPPVAHGHSSSPPAPPHSSAPGSLLPDSPPAAHNSYSGAYLTPAHTGSTGAGTFFKSQPGSWPRPAHSNMSCDAHAAQASPAAPALQASQAESLGHSCSPCSSDSSPRPASSPGGAMTSEDDTSSSSWSRRGSRGAQDEESLHRIPLKCRMKRELHSAFNFSKDSVCQP